MSITRETIEARAEALCNLWGNDPNNDEEYAEALEHAEAEAAEGILEVEE